MTNKLLPAVIVAAVATVSTASWAQVGVGGTSQNSKVTNTGAGGNASPTYPKVEASKNRKVTNHGAGGNSTPSYPKTGTH
jgi:hypothetical protein